MDAMVLEPQSSEKTYQSLELDGFSTENSEQIVSAWSEELEKQHTLHKLLPSVGDYPEIHAVT